MLPRGPVLNDNDAFEITEMTTLLNVHDAFQAVHTSDSVEELARYNPEVWNTFTWVMKMSRDDGK